MILGSALEVIQHHFCHILFSKAGHRFKEVEDNALKNCEDAKKLWEYLWPPFLHITYFSEFYANLVASWLFKSCPQHLPVVPQH